MSAKAILAVMTRDEMQSGFEQRGLWTEELAALSNEELAVRVDALITEETGISIDPDTISDDDLDELVRMAETMRFLQMLEDLGRLMAAASDSSDVDETKALFEEALGDLDEDFGPHGVVTNLDERDDVTE